MTIKIPDIEYKTADEIKVFQEGLLQKHLQYLKKHSRFYQNHFKTHSIDISKIQTLEDLQSIPPVSKQDLQNDNKSFKCVPEKDIIDYITTTGTSGDPVTFVTTENDLQRLAYNEGISFLGAGIDSRDTIQLTVTLDKRFMAGLAYFLGARAIGAGVVRVGSGIPELQWDTVRRVGTTVLIGVPSFILRLIEYAQEKGIDYKNSTVRKAICIGEPIRNSDFSLNTLGRRISKKWDIELFSTYASTEMSSAFTECPAGRGGHLHPDLLIVEFLDENDQPVDEGAPGEVTVTTLGVEGMPLLRFKTGDICHRSSAPCSCGRQSLRLGPVIGRKDQMIKYKGTTLYPPAFYDVLDSIEEVENYVVEASTNSIGMDEIYVKIGCEYFNDGLEKIIKDHFRARLRIAPEIGFFNPEEIRVLQFNGGSRKALKFIDKRSKLKNS